MTTVGICVCGRSGGGGAQQCVGACTAFSYSKNSRAGLGMPARLKLLRYHLKSPMNQNMAWAWGLPVKDTYMCVPGHSCEYTSCRWGSRCHS